MALILCVETSSKNCSVSISDSGKVLFIKEEFDQNYCHGERLHVLIQDLVESSTISLDNLDALAFSAGPGSYTGLRIGAATIKGLSVALEKKVILVSTLESMAWAFVNQIKKVRCNYFFPILDSRVGEVYAAMYDVNLKSYLDPFACDVGSFPFLEYLKTNKICFFGPGIHKLSHFSDHKNASFFKDIYPSSSYLSEIAQQHFNNGYFVDVAYFEPFYLKPFISTSSRKNN